MDFQTLTERFRNEDTLAGLNFEQSSAFVDLLILTVLIDDEITETELESLSAQWSMLPFVGDEELEAEIGKRGVETRAYIESHLHDPASMDVLIEAIASKLTDDSVREAALQMIAVVSLSDGVEEHEAELCYQVGAHFGFDRKHVASIVNELLSADIVVALDEDDSEDEDA